MDLKKVSGLENMMPTNPGVAKPTAGAGPSFRETLDRATTIKPPVKPPLTVNPSDLQGLQGITTTAASQAPGVSDVKFSNHAIERMRSRGISFQPADMQRLSDAVSRANAKGSKDSLILMNDSALIVSVKNKTVVTVMDTTALKENVFTNIDSTIVM